MEMARTASKVRLDPQWFMWVLEHRGRSIRSLGQSIGWNEKTIRRAIKDGKISSELLEEIAREIDVHPDYLAGEYSWTLDALPDEESKAEFLKTFMDPKWYPYREVQQDRVGLSAYWDQTLLMHGINKEDYLGLDGLDRARLRDDFDELTTRLFKRYFPSCDYLNAIEYREAMAWRTERDVLEAMLPYFEQRRMASMDN
jgi:hypothetical protein